MLLLAAHVDNDLMYAGSFAGEFGFLESGIPMNLVPRPRRHEEKELSAPKNFVWGSADASGIVSLVAPDAPLAPDAPGAAVAPESDAGWIAPLFVTFQPGGSWMLTWPASMVLVVIADDDFELLPHPAATDNTSTPASAKRVPALRFVNRTPTKPPRHEHTVQSSVRATLRPYSSPDVHTDYDLMTPLSQTRPPPNPAHVSGFSASSNETSQGVSTLSRDGLV